jgi:threonylcarbamoyladenosine tRNA methylthiotransferase MtaB
MDSFSIRNFGCRVNQAEGFGWAHEFQKRGLRHEENAGRGGLVIVNTCTLTGRADRDARKFIRKVLRENPSAKVVVTGCLAERVPQEFEALPGIWKVVPNREKDALPGRLFPGASDGPAEEIRTVRARAYLKVQDGCDWACAFCVIPSVRGRSSSVPGDEILARVRDLAGLGFREIVLTGIHLCSYGNDLRPRSSLEGLLGRIEDIPGDFRVRLSSLDPRLLPQPLLERLTSSPKICPHFHLALQHGSDEVLRAMGRNSTASQYREIMEYFSRAAPQAALGADVIVGFPGETDDDFRATEDFLAAAPLAYVHVFSYSPRPGTAAFSLPPVDDKTKRMRAVRLRDLSKRKNLEFRKRFSGDVLDGVVIRTRGANVEVLTPNYVAVKTPPSAVRKGDGVRVKITEVRERETLGEIIPPCPPLEKGGGIMTRENETN